MTDAIARRRYRFSARDRTGWIYGLSGTQCVILALGIFESGFFLNMQAPSALIPVPVVAAIVFAFGRWKGIPVHQQLVSELRWNMARFLGHATWTAPSNDDDTLPPFLCDFTIREADAPPWITRLDNAGVGVVLDGRDHCVSATIPVQSRRFSLCERDEQERMLDGWGNALSAFATERGPVSRISWSERAARIVTDEPKRTQHETSASRALCSYGELVAREQREAIVHETAVTVTVDLRKVHGKGRGHTATIEAGIGVLLEELRLLTLRLSDAGLDVDVPLSRKELRHAICARMDPDPREPTTGLTLAQLAGVDAPRRSPRSALLDWNWVRVDHSVHHTYWISEWPLTDVGPDWLEPLVLHAGGTRTITLHAEPVAPSRSRRQIERDATKLATDAHQRSRSGFRIGVDHERAAQAVAEREAEISSGFTEFTYVGLITVTAADAETLRESCLEYEQVAAQAGLRLQSLHAHHDLGLVCALPLGRGPAARRFA